MVPAVMMSTREAHYHKLHETGQRAGNAYMSAQEDKNLCHCSAMACKAMLSTEYTHYGTVLVTVQARARHGPNVKLCRPRPVSVLIDVIGYGFSLSKGIRV